MKKIEAFIRPETLEPVRLHLEEIGYPGMSVTDLIGHGKQRGVVHQWRGTQYKTAFVPKVKIEIVAADKQIDKLINGIIEVCGTGKAGDGKIFVYKVDDAYRVSTKESGDKAID
jgi:nitrogen regulatory protein P-II 1